MKHAAGRQVVKSQNGHVVDVFRAVGRDRDGEVAALDGRDLRPVAQVRAVQDGALGVVVGLGGEDAVLVEGRGEAGGAVGGEAGGCRC